MLPHSLQKLKWGHQLKAPWVGRLEERPQQISKMMARGRVSRVPSGMDRAPCPSLACSQLLGLFCRCSESQVQGGVKQVRLPRCFLRVSGDISDSVFCKLHANGSLQSPLFSVTVSICPREVIPWFFGISNISAMQSPMLSALFGSITVATAPSEASEPDSTECMTRGGALSHTR